MVIQRDPYISREKLRDFHSLLDRSYEYGGNRSGAVTVGVASVQVVAPYNYRRKVLLINDSSNWIYLAKGRPAVVNSGIPLAPNGGSWEEAPDNLGYIYRGGFDAISAVAGSNLCFVEDF